MDIRISFKIRRCSLAANKDELIDFAIRSGAPMEVVENLQELEDDGEMYDSIEDIWPDYPDKDDFSSTKMNTKNESRKMRLFLCLNQHSFSSKN